MKNSAIVFITLIVGIALFPPICAPADRIIFAASEWEPYIILENGKVSGLDVEIIRVLCKRLAIDPDIRILPWKRALKYAEDGKVDAVFSPRYTEDRSRFLYYTPEPLNIEKTVILALKGSGIRITKLDDLKGMNVGVVKGYVYGQEFDTFQGVRKIPAKNDKQMIRMLIKGRFSLAACTDEVTARYLFKKAGAEVEVLYALNETPNYIAFSKKRGEKGKTLADQFAQMLRKLKGKGVIQEIERKYHQ